MIRGSSLGCCKTIGRIVDSIILVFWSFTVIASYITVILPATKLLKNFTVYLTFVIIMIMVTCTLFSSLFTLIVKRSKHSMDLSTI